MWCMKMNDYPLKWKLRISYYIFKYNPEAFKDYEIYYSQRTFKIWKDKDQVYLGTNRIDLINYFNQLHSKNQKIDMISPFLSGYLMPKEDVAEFIQMLQNGYLWNCFDTYLHIEKWKDITEEALSKLIPWYEQQIPLAWYEHSTYGKYDPYND